jgi:hypothetical protein
MNAELSRTKPAGHLIKFTDDCFRVVGTAVYYTVCMSAPAYPRRFETREAAEKWAKVTGRSVSEHTTEVLERIKWF